MIANQGTSVFGYVSMLNMVRIAEEDQTFGQSKDNDWKILLSILAWLSSGEGVGKKVDLRVGNWSEPYRVAHQDSGHSACRIDTAQLNLTSACSVGLLCVTRWPWAVAHLAQIEGAGGVWCRMILAAEPASSWDCVHCGWLLLTAMSPGRSNLYRRPYWEPPVKIPGLNEIWAIIGKSMGRTCPACL